MFMVTFFGWTVAHGRDAASVGEAVPAAAAMPQQHERKVEMSRRVNAFSLEPELVW